MALNVVGSDQNGLIYANEKVKIVMGKLSV